MSIFYDYVRADELGAAYQIESQGYPEDEAGSLETFQYRQSQAPELFLGVYVPTDSGRKLIGYVCSTLSPDTTLTHESMSKHVPASSSVCIHSVCVSLEHRRQKLGLGLVKEYISRLSSDNDSRTAPYARILLIAHEELRGFYEKAGFELVGRSAVVHGARPWFEMRKVLKPEHPLAGSSSHAESGIVVPQILSDSGLTQGDSSTAISAARTPRELSLTKQKKHRPGIGSSESTFQAPPAQTQSDSQSVPPGLWEALQRESVRARPVARLLASFSNAVQDVISDSVDSSNKYDLLCPRAGCGSVILKAGVASWVERASVQLEPHGHALPPVLGPLPAPPTTAQWWLVQGSAMIFENIGFSRPVQETAPSGSGKRMKLLVCAECDLGPLGWCEEGGIEFWLACNRVGYHV